MKLELWDELIIQYGDRKLKGKPANGLDNINNSEDTIKVILEGDSSYYPKTIKKEDIVSINGEKREN